MTKRTRRKKVDKKKYLPYKSKFEYDLSNAACERLEYEPQDCVLDYVIDRKYTPDFVNRVKGIFFEAKGYFRDKPEATKYIYIQKSNPGIQLIFIFSDPKKRMPGARRRKDGTFFSMGEWADKQGIEHYTPHNIPKKYLV